MGLIYKSMYLGGTGVRLSFLQLVLETSSLQVIL